MEIQPYTTPRTSFFRLVTLKIPGIAGGNQQTIFTFPDIGDLRYARVTALETFFRNDLAKAFPENIDVIADADAAKCVLILNSNDPDKTDEQQGKEGRFSTTLDSQRWLPATAIHRTQNQAGGSASFIRQLMMFKDLYIVWDKSQLVLSSALANTTDVAFVLGVHYTFISTKGVQIKRT